MLCVGGGSVRSIFYYTSGGREKSMLLGCECRLGRTTLRRRRRHIRNVRRFAITYHVVDLSTITTKTSQKSPLNTTKTGWNLPDRQFGPAKRK